MKRQPPLKAPKSAAPVQASAQASGKTPSIREVAERAGVGLGTVSRVINGGPNVSERTRRSVLLAISDLGYVPNVVAQSMRNRRTMTVACVVRDFTVPVLSMFAEAIQNEIDAEGFSLIVASSYHNLDRELALLQRLKQRRVDGLVVTTSSETSAPLLRMLHDMACPVVLLDRETPRDLDSVLVDHERGTRQAIDHLIQLGHRRIGLITGEDGLRPSRARIAGYLKAHAAAGLAHRPDHLRVGSFGVDSAYQHARSMLTAPDRPTALIAGGTAFLPGVLRALRECELRFPDDISLVAGGDSDIALAMEPPISRIRWSHDRVGIAAGRLLMQRLENEALPTQRMMFDSEFVLGGSCGKPPRKPRRG